MPDKIDKLLERAASADVAELMAIWRAREPEEWSQSSEAYRVLGERILAQGEPLLAYDVIHEGLTKFSTDIRLRQLRGLALARSGATERANTALEELRSEGQTGEETLGMLGRTYKDLAASAATTGEREKFLARAAEIYAEAYRATGGYWTGINAATMSLLTNEIERAREIASAVREQCLKEIQGPGGDSYWQLAVLGEAALILRDWKQAEEWYARAAEVGKNRYGDLNSSRRNARLILKHWNETSSWIDKHLHIPSVMIFAGHMIDRPDRPASRFPPELEPIVAQEIQSRIDRLKPGFGFASAACGSDIVFLEAMLNRGAEISVVLPYVEEEFLRDSVDFLPKSNWRARFARVLDRAARVITASSQRLEIGGVSYEFCNDLILGLATIRAHRLDTDLAPLAVWDGLTGDGPGGAASAVQAWRSLGYEPEIVDLGAIAGAGKSRGAKEVVGSTESLRTPDPDSQVTRVLCPTGSEGFGSRIVAILFADAVGFSKLSEAEVPRFVQYFLGGIAKLSEKFRESIIAKNTWGDGLYFVFSDVDVAGNFALALAEFVAATKWEEKGFRSGLNLRIGLHAGPVYEFNDPITGSRSYSGTHVSRAARIEPITPPGQVYASELFAALAAARHGQDFTCDYVGQTPMAKGYGTLPAYHVRRTAASALVTGGAT